MWHQALFLKWQWWFLFLTAGSSPTQNAVQAEEIRSQSSLTTPTNFLSSFYPITCCKMLSMLSLKVIRLSCLVPAQVITVRFSLLWAVELLTADTSQIKAPSPRPSVHFNSLFVCLILNTHQSLSSYCFKCIALSTLQEHLSAWAALNQQKRTTATQ